MRCKTSENLTRGDHLFFCHGEMLLWLRAIRWRFGDLVQYRFFIWLILNNKRNMNIVHLIFLAKEKLKMISGRRRLALPLRGPRLLVSEIFSTGKKLA